MKLIHWARTQCNCLFKEWHSLQNCWNLYALMVLECVPKKLFPQHLKLVDCVWNVMAHAQKPDFVFRRNGRVHLNRREASVQSTTGSRGVRVSGSNAGYTMFRGSAKSTGYPLHSPVSPSLPLPCVTVSHRISTGLYVCRCCKWGQKSYPYMSVYIHA